MSKSIKVPYFQPCRRPRLTGLSRAPFLPWAGITVPRWLIERLVPLLEEELFPRLEEALRSLLGWPAQPLGELRSGFDRRNGRQWIVACRGRAYVFSDSELERILF